MVKDLDNNKTQTWHRGKIIKSSDIIGFQPGTIVNFNSHKSETLKVNDKEHDLKRISTYNVRK